jgi:hypothetical protein
MNTSKEVQRAVAEALARGDKVEAIKRLREAGGGDLKGTLALVQRMMAEAQATNGGATGSGNGPQPAAPPRAQAATQALQAAERQTEHLLGAKRTPTVMPGDSAGRGALWLLLVLIGAVAWAFLR